MIRLSRGGTAADRVSGSVYDDVRDEERTGEEKKLLRSGQKQRDHKWAEV